MLKLSDLALRPDRQLGPMLVSPSRRLVEGPGGHIHLEPLIMQVFLLLLDARGKVVTRTELFDQCWGGVIVGDDSLNRAIAKVRRTGAHVAPGLYEIETIPRTGYRLTGEILQVIDGAGAKELDRTVSRRLVIGGGVAAAALLAGGGIWWGFRDQRDPRSERLVARADQILRYEYSPRNVEATSLLEQAVAIDPGNAAALGLLAYARAVAATSTEPGTGGSNIQAAEQAIRTALTGDPDEPNARLALLLLQRGGFDWIGTEDGLRRIIAMAPGNTLALAWLVALLQTAGRDRDSWNANEQAIRLDPIAPSHQWRKALKHWIFGRNREADFVIDRQMQLWPTHPWVWNARFLILAFTERPHAALDMIDDEAKRPKTITPARMAQWRPTLAALERRSPDRLSAAREANLAAARQSPGQAAYAVMALSALGEIDAAYQVADGFLLSRGSIVTRRPSDTSNMLVNDPDWRRTQWLFTPPLAEFRADSRFGPLCDGIGLTAYWKARGIRPDYLA